MTNPKDRAIELYKQHIELAKLGENRLFRKTVMDTLMAEMGISLASAATHYNNAKKLMPVEGLGRAPAPAGMVKPGASAPKKKDDLQDDDDCFTVIELVPAGREFTVGRVQSFLMQGDASEKFDDKVQVWPNCHWVMIKGLGPNHSDTYKLDAGEQEIKRYSPEKVAA